MGRLLRRRRDGVGHHDLLALAQPGEHLHVARRRLPARCGSPAGSTRPFSTDLDQFQLADAAHGRRGMTSTCSSSKGIRIRPNMPE